MYLFPLCFFFAYSIQHLVTVLVTRSHSLTRSPFFYILFFFSTNDGAGVGGWYINC